MRRRASGHVARYWHSGAGATWAVYVNGQRVGSYWTKKRWAKQQLRRELRKARR